MEYTDGSGVSDSIDLSKLLSSRILFWYKIEVVIQIYRYMYIYYVVA